MKLVRQALKRLQRFVMQNGKSIRPIESFIIKLVHLLRVGQTLEIIWNCSEMRMWLFAIVLVKHVDRVEDGIHDHSGCSEQKDVSAGCQLGGVYVGEQVV